VLERFLGDPPQPPPPGIPGVEPDIRGASTIREQLALHRNLASCASCHNKIDPPGFALEAYDVIGGYRERYRSAAPAKSPKDTLRINNRTVSLGLKVDPSGQTAAGTPFADLAEYKRILAQQPSRIARALTEKLAIMAMGRELGFSDRAAIEKLVMASAKKKYGLQSLIIELVQSPLFLTK
jgi:hypothetical protein